MKLVAISGFFASAEAMFKVKQTRCDNVIDVSNLAVFNNQFKFRVHFLRTFEFELYE